MTELQLRLWCLWMCEEFAEFEGWADEFDVATECADDDMRSMIDAIEVMFNPLDAWELSERMP